MDARAVTTKREVIPVEQYCFIIYFLVMDLFIRLSAYSHTVTDLVSFPKSSVNGRFLYSCNCLCNKYNIYSAFYIQKSQMAFYTLTVFTFKIIAHTIPSQHWLTPLYRRTKQYKRWLSKSIFVNLN